MKVYGLDFTSAPSQRKSITCAECKLQGEILVLQNFHLYPNFNAFEAFLASPGAWIAGVDFPIALPRQLIENLQWGDTWAEYVSRVADMTKQEFVDALTQYSSQRPYGNREHKRVVDKLCGAISPMKLYGVPVGKMFFEGAPRLLKSSISLPPCRPTDSDRIVLEVYPALVARQWIARRSYKNDDKQKQTLIKQTEREKILAGIRSERQQQIYGFKVNLSDRMIETFTLDGSGDKLDALLAAIQAAWASTQPHYGIPTDCDRLEGWIADPTLQTFDIDL
jgi:hypothetical protein